MTLLIGTISNKHVVITADGLSRVNSTTGAGISKIGGQHTYYRLLSSGNRYTVPGIPGIPREGKSGKII